MADAQPAALRDLMPFAQPIGKLAAKVIQTQAVNYPRVSEPWSAEANASAVITAENIG